MNKLKTFIIPIDHHFFFSSIWKYLVSTFRISKAFSTAISSSDCSFIRILSS